MKYHLVHESCFGEIIPKDYDDIEEFSRALDKLIENRYVLNDSIRFTTEAKKTFKHEPLVEYVPTEKDLEYERFKGGRK